MQQLVRVLVYSASPSPGCVHIKFMGSINILLVNGYIIYIHLNLYSETDLGGERSGH